MSWIAVAISGFISLASVVTSLSNRDELRKEQAKNAELTEELNNIKSKKKKKK